jgi:small subunit ribosomal protein S13|tara:strand:+ start:13603 stop:13971 length:369 start_codon:yes stop_codon:yes gene_type:complete
MVRISGIDLPKNKRIEIALTYIYGINISSAKKILAATNVNPDIRCQSLDESDIIKLRGLIEEEYLIEGNLRRQKKLNIKRIMDLGSYRGRRHRTGLPLRGQRTRTNARTGRGVKKTVAGKKK